MKVLFIALCLLLTSCDGLKALTDSRYQYDASSELCFYNYMGAQGTRGYTNVPCTERVMQLIKRDAGDISCAEAAHAHIGKHFH